MHGLRFVLLGDAGTGEADQYKVAAAIGQVCKLYRCDFALELGDNIYDAGPSSARDPQFDSKFEKPYANLTFPFYMVLGNHDNSQDPANTGATAGLGTWYQAGNYEVDYAKRTDRASEKWTMPGRYYSFARDDAAFIALDTNTLVYDDVPILPDQDAVIQAQTKWVDGAVQQTGNATWRFAFGHHGYVSNGPHGNAGAYDGRPGVPGLSGDYVKSFFEAHLCGKVDVYFFGHDHDLQWLDPVAACGKTHFIGSGGGGATTYALGGSDSARYQTQSLGFWVIALDGPTLRATAFDKEGGVLYEGTLQHT